MESMKWEDYILILAGVALLAGVVVNHELTHGQIMHYYGCENVSYGADWGQFYTKCNDLEHKQSEIELLAHSNNEIIGYNVVPLIVVAIIGVTAYAYLKK